MNQVLKSNLNFLIKEMRINAKRGGRPGTIDHPIYLPKRGPNYWGDRLQKILDDAEAHEVCPRYGKHKSYPCPCGKQA